MKKYIIFILILSLVLVLSSCDSTVSQLPEGLDETINGEIIEDQVNDSIVVDSTFEESEELSNLDSEENGFGSSGALEDTEFTIEEMLIYAIQDEYTAKAEYMYIIANFDVTKPFTNIIDSEETHISLLLPLFEVYNIDVPIDDSSNHLIPITSIKEAFEIGVLAEELNIAMYELFLSQEDLPSDLIDAFTKLRDASINHLSAFQTNLNKF